MVYHCFTHMKDHQSTLPPSKLTVRPCHALGLKDQFPLKMGDFQGRTVNLPGSIWKY
jgi:hypothetical protein